MRQHRLWSVGVVVAALATSALEASAQSNEAAKTKALTDAEIAAVVVAANAIDAELGELAAGRASNASIRAFAETMKRDHRAVNEAAGALVAKLGVTPVESAVSRQLRADAAAFRTEVSAKQGAAFDRAYIEHEVAYHRAVIDAVDKLLIPSAQNAELKQTLVDARPLFAGHLRHAEELKAAVK